MDYYIMVKISFNKSRAGSFVSQTIESIIAEDSPVHLENHIINELDMRQINFGDKVGGNSS